jgi:capsular polysaccharide biosynthesis protein
MLGRLLRRRWRFFVVVAVVGALLGAVLWLLLSPPYKTSTSVLLQGTRSPEELVTETQVAKSSVVLDRTAAALGRNLTRGDLEGAVSTGIGDGNVIVITGQADSPEHTQQLTDEVARQYVSYSTELAESADPSAKAFRDQREALRQEITKVNERITALQASAAQGDAPDAVQLRSELRDLGTTLNQAMARLDQAGGVPSKGSIVVMGQAERPSARAAPTLVQLTAGGALVAIVLGVLGHFAVARRDRRLRDDGEIAAALGSPVVATVDMPDEPPADDRTAKQPAWKSLLTDVLGSGRPWYEKPLPVASDDVSRDIRYRRAVAGLRGDAVGPLRLLVLVPDDDAVAHRAATQLAAAAAALPDSTMLRLVDVAVRRPTVPDDAEVSSALVVSTLGTRTGWDLVGLAEACSEAGHLLVGAVVVQLTRPAGSGEESPGEAKQSEAAQDAAQDPAQHPAQHPAQDPAQDAAQDALAGSP